MWKYQHPSARGALVVDVPVPSTLVSGVVPDDVDHSHE
jgi:hypothetical protein